jgi:hypothetical protein
LDGHLLEILCYDPDVDFEGDVLPWLKNPANASVKDGPAFATAGQYVDEPWYSKFLSSFNGTIPRWARFARRELKYYAKIGAETLEFTDNHDLNLTRSESYVGGDCSLKQFYIWEHGCNEFDLVGTFVITRKSYGDGKKLSIEKSPGCPGGENVVECSTGW